MCNESIANYYLTHFILWCEIFASTFNYGIFIGNRYLKVKDDHMKISTFYHHSKYINLRKISVSSNCQMKKETVTEGEGGDG